MISWALALVAAAALGGSGIGASPVARAEPPKDVRGFGPNVARTFESYPNVAEPVLAFENDDPVKAAVKYVTSRMEEEPKYRVEASYTNDFTGVTNVYMRQQVDGLDVINGRANVHVNKGGEILSYGNSFASTKAKAKSMWDIKAIDRGVKAVYKAVAGEPKQITATQAVEALMKHVGLADALKSADSEMTQGASLQGQTVLIENVPTALSPARVKPAYLQQAKGELTRVWDVQLELDDHWYHAQVDATTGKLGGLVDWVADAVSYNVIPFGFNDPSETERKVVKDPHDTVASPEGWHVQGSGGTPFNTTIGNNVYAQNNPDGGEGWEKNHRPDAKVEGSDMSFDFPADFKSKDPKEYEDAAIANLFYWVNTAHDLFYRYGFDEKAGNFQEDNLGRGRGGDEGAGDSVIANAQDGSGTNNANFATPPDGQHGKMRMFVWDVSDPKRDGDFESGIVIHEFTHGVSTRLTGGPMDSSCLGYGEAGGMGEGWGDFVATIIRMTEKNTRKDDFTMGEWANGGQGIRKYSYSTSMDTNPSTYAILDGSEYGGVHAQGEVWAVMLYELYWNLVDKHGFTPDWFPKESDPKKALEAIKSKGNTLALKIVIDAMSLQPCNPGFIEARDAILAADKALTNGENYCEIYKAFAKRGLGKGAKLEGDDWEQKRTESFELDGDCKK